MNTDPRCNPFKGKIPDKKADGLTSSVASRSWS